MSNQILPLPQHAGKDLQARTKEYVEASANVVFIDVFGKVNQAGRGCDLVARFPRVPGKSITIGIYDHFANPKGVMDMDAIEGALDDYGNAFRRDHAFNRNHPAIEVLEAASETGTELKVRRYTSETPELLTHYIGEEGEYLFLEVMGVISKMPTISGVRSLITLAENNVVVHDIRTMCTKPVPIFPKEYHEEFVHSSRDDLVRF